MGDLMPWKDQLLQLLQCFTTCDVAKLVVAGEERGVFTTWSRMADKGCSLRLEHVADLRRKAFAPRAGVPAKDLELAIALCEKEVSLYEDASGGMFPSGGSEDGPQHCPSQMSVQHGP